MQIAKLNRAGILVGVETVTDDAWKTDVDALTVKLPPNHDMHLHINDYWFNFVNNCFEPLISKAEYLK